MPTKDKVVFTISIPRTLPPETWQQFTTRARAEGLDPRTVIRVLIEYFIAKGLPRHGDH